MSVWASPSGDLEQGSNVTLMCQVKSLKKDPQVEWKNPAGNKHPGSNSITLNPVELSHNGDWMCTFSHAGKPYNDTLIITVKGRTLASTKVLAYAFNQNEIFQEK